MSVTDINDSEIEPIDEFDVRTVRSADGLLRTFNEAGAVHPADVHVAMRLGALAGEGDEQVLLAVAFAVRGPRLGHVCTDLAIVRGQVDVDVDTPADIQALPWPSPDVWIDAVRNSALVADGGPLQLVGSRLYLDRYWRDENFVGADLLSRASGAIDASESEQFDDSLSRLFDEAAQRQAGEIAMTRRLAVIAGGPGTGKTTTVARILALIFEDAARRGASPPIVGLAAPTGKAAARLEEAVHHEAAQLDVDPAIRDRLLSVSASTLHRLLGWKPRSATRFRHDRFNRLPHDIVFVDETSMVSLSLMARLLEAVRPSARLILVGDPEQLASVEAGAVLGDIVGPGDDAAGAPLAPSIALLRRVYRYGGGIANVAESIRAGNAGAVLAALQAGHDDVVWLQDDTDVTPIRDAAVAAGRALTEAALAGDGLTALDALGRFRLLCAHRRGPFGVSTWTAAIERWLAHGVEASAASGSWFAGQPLLFTENDYGLRLYNGDTGVVITATDGSGLRAVFERGGQLLELSPHRLTAVETVYAMTVHKAQGSQFDEVAFVLPEPTSAILTRELLYTAVTRARRRLIVAGSEAALVAAVGRPIARASGLRDRLWPVS